jgi:DNA-binding MarR family transcriptional regulator
MKAEASARPELVPAIERATHLLGRHLERETGMPQAEAHVLARLGRGGPSSPSELHRLFGHKRSTLTSVLDRLEARGYLRREVNPADRRSFVISLTRSGKTAATRVLRTVDAVEERIAKAVAARDLEGLAAVLAALEAELAGQAPAGSRRAGER